MLLSILSAILGILAFLPFNYLWPLGFVFLVPLFIFALKEQKFWRLIAGFFIFRIIFSLGTVYFTIEPMLWFFSIIIFLNLPIAIYIMKKLVASDYWRLASLPLLWTFFDHLQARFSLFPTYIITAGNSLNSSPFLGLASINGLILLTFFAATINALIATFIFKIKSLNPKSYILYSLIIIFTIIFGWGISQFQLQKNSFNYNSLPQAIKIAAVSTNKNFRHPDLEKIKNEIVNNKIDFLILPEDILNNAPSELNIRFWSDFAKKIDAYLLITGDHRENNKRYDSSILLDKNGEIIDIYNKNRLTFIGEYWPFGEWTPSYLNWLKKTTPEIKNYAVFNLKNAYSAGNQKLLTIKLKNEEFKLATPICLEIHYLRDLKNNKKMGTQLFINPTSNRWLDLGLYHFLYLTNGLKKIEAVWLKTPIISSGVKDFAGIIAPDGKIQSINFENPANDKNYGIFIREVKI